MPLGLEGGANLTPLDLAEHDRRGGLDEHDVLRVALGRVARAGIAAVEPLHEAALVPPDAHGQHHAAAHGPAHALHGAVVHEGAGAVRLAVGIVHGDFRLDVLDDLSVLDVFADDRLERAVLGGELRHDGERLLGVDLETRAVECLVGCVRILAASVLVAHTCGAALVARTLVQTILAARVRCYLRGPTVSFPDVQFRAANALALDVALLDFS